LRERQQDRHAEHEAGCHLAQLSELTFEIRVTCTRCTITADGATLEREQQLAQAFDHAVHAAPLAEPAG